MYRTTRRAGKTTAVLSEFAHLGNIMPGGRFAYIALTRPSAEQIAWPILRELDARHNLGAVFQEAKLRIRLPNASEITLYGADRPGWASRLYGQKLAGAAIDEAAFFSVDLNDLIEDYLGPCLSDLRGRLILCSIPGHTRSGLFFDITEQGRFPEWQVHQWRALDNPHVSKQIEEEINERKRANPEAERDPTFQRNYLNLWPSDSTDFVYKFEKGRNVIEKHASEDDERYVLGLDLGWNDPTAFSLISYSPTSEKLTELETYARSEMLLDEVAAQVRMYIAEYPGLVLVGDPSRRQAFEELRKRYNLPIIPSERVDKESWIEVVNSDLCNGVIKIVEGQCEGHIRELQHLTWRYRPNGKRIEDPRFKNDICDAFLYAYRYSYHYRGQRPTPSPKFGTRAYWELEAQRIEQELVDQHEEMLGILEDDWS